MKKIGIIVILFVISTLQLYSQIAPKYSNAAFALGVGARSLGLGNAVAASVNDVTSAYWNPAGLCKIEQQVEGSLMHAEYFAGLTKYDYLGAAFRPDAQSVIAFSVLRLGVDDIQNTINLFDSNGNIDYNRVENFSVADYAFLFSYSKKTKIEGLNIGANAKIIYRNYGKFAKAYGFGIDLGAQYAKNKWLFGAMAYDITNTFNVWTFNEKELNPTVIDTILNEIPENSLEMTLPRIVPSVAREFQLSEKVGLLAEFDAVITFDGKRNTLVSSNFASINPQMGIELNYMKIIYLRIGAGNMQQIEEFEYNASTTEEIDNVVIKEKWAIQPNAGIGLKFRNISIDYAFTDIGSQVVMYSNVFSLKYSFSSQRNTIN